MADVRALLRQQREARRIEHPHAAYSDAGKLLCVVCHEHVKTETLWDNHVRGMRHRQRLQQAASSNNSEANGHGDARAGNGAQSNKRKLDDDEDMADAVADEDALRRKRNRPDMTLTDQENKENVKTTDIKPLTPPLTRRQSGAPGVGVEMRIPSRPATPVALREGSASTNGTSSASTATTPKAIPVGRSPLIPQNATAAQLPPPEAIAKPPSDTTGAGISTAPIDDVWAAFEADLVHGTSGTGTKPAAVAGFASDAVISAPAMSAADLAAKAEAEDQEKRKTLAEIQIEDEREDATRALETEFEIMEELEARAKKLRERREALRRQSVSEETPGTAASAPEKTQKAAVALGKENAVIEEEDDDDDEEETEDDWVGFRFRA